MNEEIDHDFGRTASFLDAAYVCAQTADVLIAEHRRELDRIAAILATFAAAPISIASLQPVLDLAAELNPGSGNGVAGWLHAETTDGTTRLIIPSENDE